MNAAIQPYDPAWTEMFETEKLHLEACLPASGWSIRHVGSTAVPGLAGKGIIDILVEVHTSDELAAVDDAMTRCGYIERPVPDRPEDRFFTKPHTKPRSHNLHATVAGSEAASRMIAFRDYLCSFAETAAEYQRLKMRLASSNASDWTKYSRGKNDFITLTTDKALEWQRMK